MLAAFQMNTFPCGGTALAAFEINTYSCGGMALAVFEIKPCGGTALAAFKINTYSCGRTVFVVFNLNPYPFISVEQGNKGQILSGTGKQIQYWGTGNIRKQIFDFGVTGEQANLFQQSKGSPTLVGPHWCSLLFSY